MEMTSQNYTLSNAWGRIWVSGAWHKNSILGLLNKKKKKKTGTMGDNVRSPSCWGDSVLSLTLNSWTVSLWIFFLCIPWICTGAKWGLFCFPAKILSLNRCTTYLPICRSPTDQSAVLYRFQDAVFEAKTSSRFKKQVTSVLYTFFPFMICTWFGFKNCPKTNLWTTY